MSLCSRALVVAFVFFTVATAHVSAALGPSPLNPCPESLFRVSSSHFGAAVAALLVKNAASFILQAILPSNKDPQQQQEEENQKDSSVASPSQAAAPSVNRHHQLMQDRETQLRTPPCSSPLRISALQNLFKLTKALHSNRPSHPFVREDRTPKDLTTFCRAL